MNGVSVEQRGKVEGWGVKEGDGGREKGDEFGAKGGGVEKVILKVVCDVEGFCESEAFMTGASD